MARRIPFYKHWLPLAVLLLGIWFALPVRLIASQPTTSTVFKAGDLVAHAMGGIDGKRYTNSLDAFLKSYAAGRRTFEVDLALTSDGELVGLHDWSPELLGGLRLHANAAEKGGAFSHRHFMLQRIFNRYRPIDAKMLVGLLHDHPDATIITDTKLTQGPGVAAAFQNLVAEAKRTDPAVLDRIVPQIYNQPMLDEVLKVYPFRSTIYALYLSPDRNGEVLRFVRDRGIRGVSMPAERATPRFVQRLKAEGVYVYAHVVNDRQEMANLAERGVDGFYTDTLTSAF